MILENVLESLVSDPFLSRYSWILNWKTIMQAVANEF